MRPGQVTPSELEAAILLRISEGNASLRPLVNGLRVLSRQFTGVGSFTEFECPGTSEDLREEPLCLKNLVRIPNVPNGLGALLWCRRGRPKCLELYTIGNERWDGVFEGFSLDAP